MAAVVRTRVSYFVFCCLLSITPQMTFGEVRGRGRRSDDSGPLEVVVDELSRRVEQLAAQSTAHDTRLQQLALDNTDLQTRLGAVEQPVAFTARFASFDVTGLGKGQTLKLDQVLYNAGSGYDPTTGLFTAPSSGTYIFYFQLMRHADDSTVSVGLYHGAALLARVYVCCSTNEAASAAVTAHLQQGDHVHLQVTQGTSLYGNVHTAFSGAKLAPL